MVVMFGNELTPSLIAVDLVAEEEHLGDVHLVDVVGVGDDDGGLGAAPPPRVVVHPFVMGVEYHIFVGYGLGVMYVLERRLLVPSLIINTYYTSVPVVRQRHVVALVDANAAVGAVVRRDVVDVDVVAAPNCDGTANEP